MTAKAKPLHSYTKRSGGTVYFGSKQCLIGLVTDYICTHTGYICKSAHKCTAVVGGQPTSSVQCWQVKVWRWRIQHWTSDSASHQILSDCLCKGNFPLNQPAQSNFICEMLFDRNLNTVASFCKMHTLDWAGSGSKSDLTFFWLV